MTVTGKTMAENLDDLPGLKDGQQIVRPLSNPMKPTGHIQILKGNLAPEGAVAKITGKEGLRFSVRRKCTIPKKTCCTGWSRRKSAKAT